MNNELRQDRTAADMIVRPARALTLLSRFQPLAPGDLLLTGTPGGTALRAPPKALGFIGRAAATSGEVARFFAGQAKNPAYLQDGDVVTATVATTTERSTSASSALR